MKPDIIAILEGIDRDLLLEYLTETLPSYMLSNELVDEIAGPDRLIHNVKIECMVRNLQSALRQSGASYNSEEE